MIENAIKVPILIPAIVITGINPFFNACLYFIDPRIRVKGDVSSG